jgi:hypothetical protein
MLVKAPMGQASLVHQVGDAQAIKAAFTESLGCDPDDPIVPLPLVCLRMPHFSLPVLPLRGSVLFLHLQIAIIRKQSALKTNVCCLITNSLYHQVSLKGRSSTLNDHALLG